MLRKCLFFFFSVLLTVYFFKLGALENRITVFKKFLAQTFSRGWIHCHASFVGFATSCLLLVAPLLALCIFCFVLFGSADIFNCSEKLLWSCLSFCLYPKLENCTEEAVMTMCILSLFIRYLDCTGKNCLWPCLCFFFLCPVLENCTKKTVLDHVKFLSFFVLYVKNWIEKTVTTMVLFDLLCL